MLLELPRPPAPPARGVADGDHLASRRPFQFDGRGDDGHLVHAGALVEADPRAAVEVGYPVRQGGRRRRPPVEGLQTE